jgi:hypothetical protein
MGRSLWAGPCIGGEASSHIERSMFDENFVLGVPSLSISEAGLLKSHRFIYHLQGWRR